MKKQCAIIMLMFMLAVSLYNMVTVYAGEELETTIEISDVNVEPGTMVEMDVSIKNNPGVMGGTFELTYDSALSLISAEAGDAFSALTLTKPGKYASGCKFVWDGVEIKNEDIKDGIILKLSFSVSEEAVRSASYNVKVECVDAIDSSLNPIGIVAGVGNVNINASTQVRTLESISAVKTKYKYNIGDELNIDDIVVTASYSDEYAKVVSNYTTNASELDMNISGEKELVISYEEGGVTKTSTILIVVDDNSANNTKLIMDGIVAFPGEQAVINISVTNNPGILGMTLKLNYDSKLKLTAIESGKAFDNLTMTKPAVFDSGCRVLWDGIDFDDSSICDGVIVTLRFDVSEEAEVGEKLIVTAICEDPVDRNLNKIKISNQSGVITVAELTGIEATKKQIEYKQGEELKLDDLVVTAIYNGDESAEITDYITNASEIDMSSVGTKVLKISYTKGRITKSTEIAIKVNEKNQENDAGTSTPGDTDGSNKMETDTSTDITGVPEVGTTKTSDDGKGNYMVTTSDEVNGTVTYIEPQDKSATTVVIPATITIDGITYKVTKISDTAFAGNKNLISITIGDNVTSIPANAFKNLGKLVTVKLGSGIKSVGENAFYGCSKLKNVTIGKNVTAIGVKAFYKCTALTKISLPDRVKTIGKQAFYGCKNITSVTIGKKVTTIGSRAFYGCRKIKTLKIKTTKLTAKKIGSKAFSKTPKSMKVTLPKKKFKMYKSMLIKKGVNKKAKFKKG